MRLTVPIVAALFIASTQAAPTPQEPTDSLEDAWNAAVTGLPPSQNPHTLFIQGLPQPCTDEELRGLWWDNIRSKITKITIPVHENGQNKDYARVEFDSDEDMQAALSSNAGLPGVAVDEAILEAVVVDVVAAGKDSLTGLSYLLQKSQMKEAPLAVVGELVEGPREEQVEDVVATEEELFEGVVAAGEEPRVKFLFWLFPGNQRIVVSLLFVNVPLA
ncbi:hypothetical protein QFC21_005750 [Naganishia friedmannii]|uniref:Uncharacterized protein n=1 Tax=Naganishia friedmannii TaxID=89922 RepID=A0ACC2V6H5_9TREE|nr:hypothetical protein QFC21_005750 [Naganishia friedmannii]